MLQIFAIIDDTSVMNFRKNLQHNFLKMRGGGGQRPFGTFPKIHPFWKGLASLIDRNGDCILYYYVDMGMGALKKVKIDVFSPESFFVYFEDVLYLRLFVSSNRCTFNSS